MLNDPEFDKMIIYGLAGVCCVLLLAVLFLAVKKNIYYVDEDGREVPSPKKSPRISSDTFRKKPKAEPAAEPEPEPVSVPEPEPEPEPVYAAEPEPEPVEEPEIIGTEEPEAEPVLPIFAPHDVLDTNEPEEAEDATAIVNLEEEEETWTPAEEAGEVTVSEESGEPEAFEEEPAPLRMITLDDEPEEDPFVNQVPVMNIPKATGLTVTITVGGQVETHEIDELPCLIGREQMSCNLVISEPAVSRRHARIYVNEDGLFIEDVSEHNGTYINGTKLPSLGSAPLRENDRISLGRAEITVNRIIY